MTITRHPLAELHPALVALNNDVTAELNPFYNETMAAFTKFEAAIAKAGEVSDDLKPEIKRQKQQEIMGQAYTDLQTAVDKEGQPYLNAVATIRQEMGLDDKEMTRPRRTPQPTRAFFCAFKL